MQTRLFGARNPRRTDGKFKRQPEPEDQGEIGRRRRRHGADLVRGRRRNESVDENEGRQGRAESSRGRGDRQKHRRQNRRRRKNQRWMGGELFPEPALHPRRKQRQNRQQKTGGGDRGHGAPARSSAATCAAPAGASTHRIAIASSSRRLPLSNRCLRRVLKLRGRMKSL